jgi:hypothetical protein
MSKSAPKAPDYAAAAKEQAQSSREVTEQQSWANRPNQQTPWGEQSWQATPTYDPATGQMLNKWQQTTKLTPESQRALDAELGLQAGRAELGSSLFPRAQEEFGDAMDWSKFDPMGAGVKGGSGYNQQANEAIYNQWADRALPQQEKDTDRLRTRLYNMGVKEGDEIYDEEMRKLGETQSDAQRQAQYQATIGAGQEASRMQGQDLAASGFDTQRRQQQIAEEMSKRGFSLNEINAIISGQQVAMPSMPGFNQATKSEGLQSLQAAQMTGQAELDRFNAQQAATQGMMSGIGSMAGAGMMMSDRRFKTDIERIGETKGGTPLYTFRYIFGGPMMVGVMADEVPHAVTKIAGISFVDYSKVK